MPGAFKLALTLTTDERKTTWTLTRFEVHHLSDKPIVCDGELGELQFVQAVDVSLALRPVIHNVL